MDGIVNPRRPGSLRWRKGPLVVWRGVRRGVRGTMRDTVRRWAGRRRTDAVAPGVCAHRTRVGMDSYQLPSVAYGSAGKPKVPKMTPQKGPAQTFQV